MDTSRQVVSTCADCGVEIEADNQPAGGWQLEDGRTVCNQCCVDDTRTVIDHVLKQLQREPS